MDFDKGMAEVNTEIDRGNTMTDDVDEELIVSCAFVLTVQPRIRRIFTNYHET